MKKKEMKKRIKALEARVKLMEPEERKCKYCENYQARKVTFRPFEPLPTFQQTKEVRVEMKET